MQLTFAGAARTVTGSMHLLEVNGHRILLDCGLFQGHRAEAYQRNSHFPFAPKSIERVILSHAHIDHSGNLPTLVKQGFAGDIICTAATRDLAAVMLRDSARIQVTDAAFVNKNAAKNGARPPVPPVVPLYTPEDAERTIDQLVGVSYDRQIDVAPGVSLIFRDAGHILGSAIVVLDLTEGERTVHLVFTGDLGRRNTPIWRDPTVVTGADYVITESTYADQVHDPISVAEDHLAVVVNRTIARRGHVIIPCFAVGRTQEIVYSMHRQRLAGVLADVPIDVDSPLAMDATDVFRLHPECFDSETADFIRQSDDPFGFRRLKYLREAEESKTLNNMKEPFVVIAASGMCESGRVLHHLLHGLGDPANTVILVGYQAENTLGRRIQDGAKVVRIYDEDVRVRAGIEVISGFSAHADRNELLWWAGQLGPNLKQAFVVHGEEDKAQILATALLAQGVKQATVPASGQSVSL